MSDQIIVAIIGGCFTLLAAVVVVYHETLSAILRGKYKHIRGTWTGKGEEFLISGNGLGDKIRTYEINCQFFVRGNIIKGKASCQDDTGDYHEYSIRGQIHSDSYSTGTFTAKEPGMADFGVSCNFIHGNRKRMDSYAIANRIDAPGIVFVVCHLDKQS